MLVLLQHGSRTALVAHRLPIGAQLHTLGEARRQLEEELQLPQQSVDPWGARAGGVSLKALRAARFSTFSGRRPPASLVMRSWRSCSVALMRALKSVITAMLVASRSISSSIFRKSFFILRMVSARAKAQEREKEMGGRSDRHSTQPEDTAQVLSHMPSSQRH